MASTWLHLPLLSYHVSTRAIFYLIKEKNIAKTPHTDAHTLTKCVITLNWQFKCPNRICRLSFLYLFCDCRLSTILLAYASSMCVSVCYWIPNFTRKTKISRYRIHIKERVHKAVDSAGKRRKKMEIKVFAIVCTYVSPSNPSTSTLNF